MRKNKKAKRKDPVEALLNKLIDASGLEKEFDAIIDNLGGNLKKIFKDEKAGTVNPFEYPDMTISAEAKKDTEEEKFRNAKDITHKVRCSTKGK